MTTRRPLVPAAVLALALLAGCGSSSPAADTTTAPASDTSGCKPAAATPTEGQPPITTPDAPATQLEETDQKVGSGPVAKAGDQLSVDYVGVSCATGKQFDSSYGRGEPFQFTLGQGMVIGGWDEGMAGMKVGGRRELVIPPALGYPDGNGDIPAGDTLVFVVELRAIG